MTRRQWLTNGALVVTLAVVGIAAWQLDLLDRMRLEQRQDPSGLLWGLASIVLLVLFGGWLPRRTDRRSSRAPSDESAVDA